MTVHCISLLFFLASLVSRFLSCYSVTKSKYYKKRMTITKKGGSAVYYGREVVRSSRILASVGRGMSWIALLSFVTREFFSRYG